jgi:hypothetical protein
MVRYIAHKQMANPVFPEVMWHMSDWHVLSMIMVWTKYVESMFPDIRETDLITDTWRRFLQIS